MLLKFQLDVELDDLVILPGYPPLVVIEVHDNGMLVLWDNVRGKEVNVNVPAMVRNILHVKRTEIYVISQA